MYEPITVEIVTEITARVLTIRTPLTSPGWDWFLGFALGQELDEGWNVRADKTPRLPPGYWLDLVDDPCVIVIRREDATVVALFTHNADPEEIRRTAEEDRRLQSKGRHD